MFSLSIIFVLLLTIYDPHATQNASVGMYSGCDYLLSLYCSLGRGPAGPKAVLVRTRVLELTMDGRPAGHAERAALCASCISMVTMFFAHGPTVLTNRVRYDTKRHFLKIFFVVYSIINSP